MATIDDVARAAAVSLSTVSRVFSKPELVQEKTRQRVLDAAEQLGYAPSRIARSLAVGKTGNVGLVVPDIANPFFAPLIKAVQMEARRTDRALFIADWDEHRVEEYPLVLAMAKQVDGIILASPQMPDANIQRVAADATTVLINRRVSGVPSVLIPSKDGMRQAVEHLAALGHTSCAYLAGPRSSWSNSQRRSALREACRRCDMTYRELGPFEPHYESGVRAADPLIAEGVTAVVAFDDVIALGLISRLRERGYETPDDISVIGVDDSPLAAMYCPPLTTVRVPSAEAGEVAARLLLGSLAGASTERSQTVELPTDLIVRGTTGTNKSHRNHR